MSDYNDLMNEYQEIKNNNSQESYNVYGTSHSYSQVPSIQKAT